jgi:hypothetical protein
MAQRPRLVLIVLDSVPPAALSPQQMPELWQIAAAGGYAPAGGLAGLPAMTYPSNATIVTGCGPARHGVRSNQAARPLVGVVPGWAGAATVQTDTLFRACRRAGLRSAAILGDQSLFAVIGAAEADLAWPPGGALPVDTPVDPFGYAADDAVWSRLLAAAADPELDFVFGHINGPDTYGHLFGPADPTTLACYAAADRMLGEVAAALRADWGRSLLVVISDHGMEPLGAAPPIDLWGDPELRAALAGLLPEGGCAWLRPAQGVSAERLAATAAAIAGVAACEVAGPELVLAIAERGRPFSVDIPVPICGFHGGPATAITLAVVGGGHAAVRQVAASIAARPPATSDWAPTAAAYLGLALPHADGLSLLAE